MNRRDFINLGAAALIAPVAALEALADDRTNGSVNYKPDSGVSFELNILGKEQENAEKAAVVPAIDDLVIVKHDPFDQDDYKHITEDGGKDKLHPMQRLGKGARIDLAEYRKKLGEPNSNNLVTLLMGFSRDKRIAIAGGTGIIIGDDGYVLTAAHVIEPAMNQKDTRFQIISYNGNDRVVQPGQILAYSKKRDLALVKIVGYEGKARNVPIKHDAVMAGERIIAINREYPAPGEKASDKNSNFGTYSGQNPMRGLKLNVVADKEQGWVMAVDPQSVRDMMSFGYAGSQGTQLFRSTADFPMEAVAKVADKTYNFMIPGISQGAPGNSGSPIFDAQGNLTGCLTAGSSNHSSMLLSSPQSVMNFLQQYQANKKK
jgi:S1-C subfamily serine protease